MQSECYINNNGIVECFLPLTEVLSLGNIKYPNGFIPWAYLWEKIASAFSGYINIFKNFYAGERIFICISIVGCKGVTSQSPDIWSYHTVKIDRDTIICMPVCIEDLSDENESELVLKKLYIEYLLAMGIRGDKDLNEFIKELYGN